MAIFQKPFFKSENAKVQDQYTQGVLSLQVGNMPAASRHFAAAMAGGHVSATYNCYLLWGSGTVSPYDFDVAADCLYKAAAAGHPGAKESLYLIEAADRGGLGTDNLGMLIQREGRQDALSAPVMVSSARFFDVLCRQYGATADVIAYELDGASTSDWDCVHNFIERTGIRAEFYDGGLNRLTPGSAADQITDGLNKFSTAMLQVGYSGRLAAMARCSIVGYIIRKSTYGRTSQALLGIDRFFEGDNDDDYAEDFDDLFDDDVVTSPAPKAEAGLPIHPMMATFMQLMANPRCAEWFGRVAHGWNMGLPIDVGDDVNNATKLARMIAMVSPVTATDLAEAAESGDYAAVNRRLQGLRA